MTHTHILIDQRKKQIKSKQKTGIYWAVVPPEASGTTASSTAAIFSAEEATIEAAQPLSSTTQAVVPVSD